MIRNLTIGGVMVPFLAANRIDQSYEEIGGFHPLRMMNGAGVLQQNWAKLATSVSGSGIVPAGLATLDMSVSQTMLCAAERGVSSSSNVIVIPANRRTDTGYTPYGHAILSDGRHIPTAVSLATNTATLTTVTGAIGYEVFYWPQLTVMVTKRPQERAAVNTTGRSWTLQAEEV